MIFHALKNSSVSYFRRLIFFFVSILFSLKYTDVEPALVPLTAVSVGFFGALNARQKELKVSPLISLAPNLVLQFLYFSDVG
jgi:hypothetical protein